MDLRSIKPGLAAVQHPLFMTHPKTGEMITPLAYTKSGRVVWPVMGGAPDDDDTGGGDDKDEDDDSEEEDDDSGEDGDDDNEGEDDDDKSKSKKKDKDARIKALEEEKDRHFKKAEKEKKRANELEARLRALEEKDLKPEEKEQRAKDAQAAKDKQADAANAKLRLENAFLRANEIDWVKPEQALAILLSDDDYEIEFDDDGKVDRKSLRAELKRLAKANPHLVKKTESKDDKDADDEDEGAQRATASKMNGQRKGKKAAGPTREELAKKFPALGRMS